MKGLLIMAEYSVSSAGVFTNRTSWMVYDVGNVMGLSTKGYFGGYMTGVCVLFAVLRWVCFSRRVLRFEARTLKPCVPPTCLWGIVFFSPGPGQN